MQRKKILIISGDFDSCFDILSKNLHEAHPNLQDEKGKIAAAIAKQALLNYLEKITADYDQVELYVGSNRQSRNLNTAHMKHNQNGCCFETYVNLCKEKNWIFRQLLLADTQNNNQPAGTAMNDEKLNAEITDTKINIILGQFDDVKKNHPHDTVDFVFIDDDTYNKIIPDIQQYFTELKHPLPKHINQLSLTRYDWFETVGKNQPSLMKQTIFKRPARNIKLDLNKKVLSENITVNKMEVSRKRKNSETLSPENSSINFFNAPANKKIRLNNHASTEQETTENMHQIIKEKNTYRWM